MIRVLHSVHKMNMGGIQSFIMNVYRNIDRAKVQFDFLVSESESHGDYDEEIKSLGGRIFQVPGRKKGIYKHIIDLNDFFKKHPEYQIVHVHVSSLSNVSVLRVAKKYGVICRIIHSHNTSQGGSPIHKYIHRINQISLKSYATDYFACSDLASRWMFPKVIYENNSVKIINNGIEVDRFLFNKNVRNEFRKKLSVEGKLVIGHIGRFHKQKNHDFLIDIFKELNKTNKNSVLILVGDGELRHNIEDKVRDLGLESDVIFTGVRTDIPELFQAMDMFLMPSLHEGLPVTLVEAQASGLYCLVSDNITKQVNITNLIKNVSLKKKARYWADKIQALYNIERINTKSKIVDSGFSIQEISQELQNYYIKKIEEGL